MRFLVLLVGSLAVSSSLSSEPRPLSLRDAVEAAQRLSPQIQIAKLRTLESRGQYGVVRSGYLPQLNAQASNSVQTNNLRGIGLTFPGVPSRIGPFQVFDARPTLQQTVFDYALVKQMSAARERIREARLDADSLRETTLLGVVGLYLRTLQSQARADATEARLENARALAKQAQDFLEVGTGNRLDLVRSQNRLESESAALAQHQRDTATAKLLLLDAIGLPIDDEVVLTERLELAQAAAWELEAAEREALANRPEILAVLSRLEAARLQVSGARAERLPTVAFAADYGVLGERIGSNLSTYNVRGVMNVPIFQGGRIQAEVMQAKSRLEQAEQEKRDIESQIRLDVRAAGLQLEAAEVSARAAQRAVTAAAESVELSQLRFEAGLTSNIDVVSAQQDQAQADELRVQTLYDYYLARANLAKAVGDVTAFLD
jgi:outer membrane protein TolC